MKKPEKIDMENKRYIDTLDIACDSGKNDMHDKWTAWLESDFIIGLKNRIREEYMNELHVPYGEKRLGFVERAILEELRK